MNGRRCLVLLTALACMLWGGAANAQLGVNLRLMPLGDSITAGYQSSTGNGYRGPLFTALSAQVGTLNFVGSQLDGTMTDPNNEGHFGDKISDIAALATGTLNTYHPNIILLHIGSNDMNADCDVGTAPDRLAALIDQIVAAEPDATLLVAQLIPSQYPPTEANITTFNAQVPAIVAARARAGEHVAVVNMDNLTPAEYTGTLHPNDAGYQQMAANWDAAIGEAIAAGWVTEPVAGSLAHPVGNITSGLMGGCIDDGDNASADGNPVDIAACSAGPSQQWDANNGNIVINGKCLDNSGGGTANGNKVVLWECHGGANQVWINSGGRLVNPASNKCLDDPDFSTTPGTPLQLWDCNGNASQEWHLPSVGLVVSGLASGTAAAPLCLDDATGSDADRNPVDVAGCGTGPAEQWQLSNEQVLFGGKCLDASGGGTADGTPVILYGCHGGANQVWIPTSGRIVNPVSGKCLAVPASAPASASASGTQLVLATCASTAGQMWQPPSY